jgi:hypothetical protein
VKERQRRTLLVKETRHRNGTEMERRTQDVMTDGAQATVTRTGRTALVEQNCLLGICWFIRAGLHHLQWTSP